MDIVPFGPDVALPFMRLMLEDRARRWWEVYNGLSREKPIRIVINN